MKNTIAQFIPIVVIYALLSQYKGCILFSHTIMGKILAIMIILFYTLIDKTIGLFACALIILFYQMDCNESVLNKEAFHDLDGKTIETLIHDKELPTPEFKETKPAKSTNKEKIEAFENYNDMYNNSDTHIVDEPTQNAFREENCKKGVLKYKNMDVNNEMAHHVFPEISFKDEYCNVCKPTCKFSIIEAKFRSEKKVETEQSS